MSNTDRQVEIATDILVAGTTGKINERKPAPSNIHFVRFIYEPRRVRDLLEVKVSIKRHKRPEESVGTLVFRHDEYEQFRLALSGNINHTFILR